MVAVVPGDTVELVQKDGEKIQVIVTETGFVVKAPFPGTKLAISRDSSFCIMSRTVKAGSTQFDTPTVVATRKGKLTSVLVEEARRAGEISRQFSFTDEELALVISVIELSVAFLEGKGQRWSLALTPLREELEQLKGFVRYRQLNSKQ